MMTDGKTNLNNFVKVKCSERPIFMLHLLPVLNRPADKKLTIY